MRNLVGHWPLVERSRESTAALCDYIKSFGSGRTVQYFRAKPEVGGRFHYSDDLKGFNFDRKETTLGRLIGKLRELKHEANPPALYAGAVQLKGGLARLRAANPNPLLSADTEQLSSIWMGNRGCTATHWDLPQNIACVVAGRRRFTLFPPEQLPNLYIGPVDFTLAGQPVSLVDPVEPDFERFPRYREALDAALVVELEPGDALYLPSMWFHQVESLDPLGVLVNFWWRDAEPYMFTPLFTLMHALLSIRDMPERERQIWKEMFDHYIFSGGEEAMQHIPEDARGVFGQLTPQRLSGLRAHLVHSLGGVPRHKA